MPAGKRLLRPAAEFVIDAASTRGAQRVYVNVVSTPDDAAVPPASMDPDAAVAGSRSVSIPHIVGPLRVEVDPLAPSPQKATTAPGSARPDPKPANDAVAVEVCVHAATARMASAHPPLRAALVDAALDAAARAYAAVAAGGGTGGTASKRANSAAPSIDKASARVLEAPRCVSATGAPPAMLIAAAGAAAAAASSVATAAPAAPSSTAAAPPLPQPRAWARSPAGSLLLPPANVTLSCRYPPLAPQSAARGDAATAPPSVADAAPRPSALVLRVHLPGVTSAAQLELDVEPDAVTLSMGADVALPPLGAKAARAAVVASTTAVTDDDAGGDRAWHAVIDAAGIITGLAVAPVGSGARGDAALVPLPMQAGATSVRYALTYRLPSGVDPDAPGCSASLDRDSGVLTLVLPLAAPAAVALAPVATPQPMPAAPFPAVQPLALELPATEATAAPALRTTAPRPAPTAGAHSRWVKSRPPPPEQTAVGTAPLPEPVGAVDLFPALLTGAAQQVEVGTNRMTVPLAGTSAGTDVSAPPPLLRVRDDGASVTLLLEVAGALPGSVAVTAADAAATAAAAATRTITVSMLSRAPLAPPALDWPATVSVAAEPATSGASACYCYFLTLELPGAVDVAATTTAISDANVAVVLRKQTAAVAGTGTAAPTRWGSVAAVRQPAAAAAAGVKEAPAGVGKVPQAAPQQTHAHQQTQQRSAEENTQTATAPPVAATAPSPQPQPQQRQAAAAVDDDVVYEVDPRTGTVDVSSGGGVRSAGAASGSRAGVGAGGAGTTRGAHRPAAKPATADPALLRFMRQLD